MILRSRHSKLLWQLLVYANVLACVVYVCWRITSTLPGFAWSPLELFAYVLVAAEVVLVYTYASSFELPKGYKNHGLQPFDSLLSDRSPEVESNLDWYGASPPPIDIFIPTHNEPWSVLEKTFVGVLNQNYPNYRVWVLDDGRREWLREKARSWGVGYLSRTENAHYKAGNVNHALSTLRAAGTAAEFVALLDADFIARPEFLRRTIALMKTEDVGIVQTPQFFYNPDPFQRIFGVRNWPEDQRIWFDVEQRRLDAAGDAKCAGTACLLRSRAIDAIGGGLPTESVTEDTLCSIRIREKGWRTVYLWERLAVGLAAEGLHEWFTQRTRWTRGGLQNRAMGKPSAIHRLPHFWISYLRPTIEVVRALMWTIALVLYWYSGWWVLKSGPLEAAFYFVPLWLADVAWTHLFAARSSFFVTTSQAKLKRFMALRVALLAALPGEPPPFETTQKGRRREGVVIHWSVLRWHAVLALALVSGVSYAFLWRADELRTDPWVWVNLALSAYVLAEILAALAPTIERPERRRNVRYPTVEAIEIAAEHLALQASCRDISLDGLLVDIPAGQSLPRDVRIHVAQVGWIPARWARRAGNGLTAFAFDDESHRVALIKKLYLSDDYVPLPDSWSWRSGFVAFLRWLGSMGRPVPEPRRARVE